MDLLYEDGCIRLFDCWNYPKHFADDIGEDADQYGG
jgi:hypothetical protein